MALAAPLLNHPNSQGGSKSSVTYAAGSTTGSTVSATHAFKQNYSVSVSAEAGFLGTGGELGANFSYGRSSSNAQSLEIKKTGSYEITVQGHSNDGIDHNRDLIYLWLNPTLNLRLTDEEAMWGIGNGALANIQYVYVGWLKDPSQMPANVAERLQAYGLTTEDYDVIYKTFMFAPVETGRTPALFGSVEDASGNDLSGREVLVIANGITYRTFTNSKGEYRIFGNISGPALIRVDNVWRPLLRLPLERRFDLVLP